MADTVLLLKQAEDFFQNLTLRILGLDPAAPANQARARIGWPVYPSKGMPAWKVNEDVVFLLLTYDDDAVTRQLEDTYKASSADIADLMTSYTRVIRVSWICYGPNSFDDTDVLRRGLFRPDFTQLLRASNLALITEVPMPVRSPELFNAQWWDRSNFYARFNEKVTRHSDVPYLQSGNVQIVKG
jgi:hypothetical protein